MKNILIVGAHYDDAELGAGGAASKMVKEGSKVYKITLTDNEFNADNIKVSISHGLCAESSKKVCDMLGIEELEFPQAQYGCLEYSTEIMHVMENIVIKKNIDTIIMHHDSDMHHDHEVAYEICKTAGRHCDNILTYQSNGYILDEHFCPNFFIDISDYIDLKTQALYLYEMDQKEQNNQGRLFDVCLKRNYIWGYANHVEYAEGFRVIKMLNR